MPRLKTEAKRKQILDGASRVYMRLGFTGATLDDVAREISASKSTIYNYFSSREDLLIAVLVEGFAPWVLKFREMLETPEPIEQRLRTFARAFLAAMVSEYSIGVARLSISEIGRSDLSDRLARAPELDIWPAVQASFERAIETGQLQCDTSPVELTRWLRALLTGDLFYKSVTDTHAEYSPQAVAESADRAVDIFLKALIPPTPQKPLQR